MKLQKEGIVYTPEKITNFIAKTTIDRFLIEKINNKFSTKLVNLDILFEKYIQKGNYKQISFDLPITKHDREQFEYIFEVLKNLTVLDPAVGSGHFLIAALKVLEKYFRNLKSLEILDWPYYKIRKHIISNTLYGIDIETEAIKNTKQRLLLALANLIEDMNDANTLQNVDSNYRIGNALIGFIRQSEIRNPHFTDIIDCFYNEIKSVFQTHKDLRKLELRENEKKAMVHDLKPFHWFLEFPDVIAKGGFDIIIENPPYISNRQLIPLEKAIYEKRYKTPKGLMNTFGIFIERSIELCHSSSRISNIVHKNLIRSNNYDLLRKFLLQYTTIEEIIDLGAGAFHSVTAETVIIILTIKPPPKDHKILIKTKFPDQKYFTLQDVLIKQVSQKTFLEQENYNINLNLQYKELEIIDFIKKNRDCELIKYFEAKTCIATGDDEKFLTDHKINHLYKKTLRGKNIGRFYIDFDNMYVFYDSKALHRARDEAIFLKPEKLIMQTISSNLTVAYDNQKYYPLSTCIAIIPKISIEKEVSIRYLLLLMNSKLMNFYYDFVFNLGAQLTTEISVNNINRLPLKLQNDYEIFNYLSESMSYLNRNLKLREKNKGYILYLDDLINILIYETILSDKFQTDALNIDPINLISQYLVNVDSDSIEEIQNFIEKLKNDKEINNQIRIIKQHPWVKIIEENFEK